MTKEEIEELIGLAAGMGLYDDKNPGKRAVILGKAIKELQQEPCKNAISRQEMLKYFEGWKNKIKYYHPYAKNFDIPYEEAIQWVKDMSPVNPQEPTTGQWISVSERLPKVNQRVLVTSYGRVCYAMMISADGNSGHPVFKLQDSLNERVVCETTVHSEFTTNRITAWMSIPTPYKAEGSKG